NWVIRRNLLRNVRLLDYGGDEALDLPVGFIEQRTCRRLVAAPESTSSRIHLSSHARQARQGILRILRGHSEPPWATKRHCTPSMHPRGLFVQRCASHVSFVQSFPSLQSASVPQKHSSGLVHGSPIAIC